MQDISKIHKKQSYYFNSDITKNVDFRIHQLKKLKKWITSNERRICKALHEDLNKSGYEARITELFMTIEELNLAISQVRKWAKPLSVKTALSQLPAKCRIYHEPYGCVLIMAPWNYPFLLSVSPLIGAIAAGNCAMLKPSAYAPATSKLLANMAKELFDEHYIAVIEGGRKEISGLLDENFDYIFFTGSVAVGKVVMAAASKNLTPVTLELGGKSPCIVDQTADLKRAAKRLIWGKLVNSGQTCIAPDYLLVHQSVKDELIHHIEYFIHKFFGSHPETHLDFPKIINEKHYNRLMGLMQDSDLVLGGIGNPITRQIAPTLVNVTDWQHPLMKEEIFGPILPVLTYEHLTDAILTVKEHPKPLALYLFTRSKAVKDKVLSSVSFGGGCVNDTILHIASANMPFGGVGNSGMGRYHGKYSFETFSHHKSIVDKGRMDFPVRYPPYPHL